MTKRMWFIIGLVLCIWVALFPVFVLAEGDTYVVLSGCTHVFDRTNGYREFFDVVNNTSDVRSLILVSSNGYKYYALVSENTFGFTHISRSQSSSTTCAMSQPDIISIDNGYAVVLAQLQNIDTNTGILPVHNINSTALSAIRADAIYYTFGEGSIGPTPTPVPIDWGLLRDVEYGTRVAGNGEASRQNIDYLSWNTLLDTNGNDISECEVEIRAVYGKWTGNTTEDVMGLDYQDLAISGNVTLATLDASVGTYSVRWQDVVNALNAWDFEDLSTHAVDNQIEKNGWYYQIMLIPSDGTQGQWQTVYTPLSSSAQSSEIVLNHNSFDMSVNQVYQQLTQINNTTSITINIEGSDYTIQNPDDGEEPETVEDWDIFKQILNAIFQTIKAITGLPAKIAEKLLDNAQLLLTPPASYDGSLAQRFDQEYEEYMSTKQQTIYDFLEGVKDLEPYINQRIPANQGAHECIITWEDVTMDLTPFEVGQVTFINGGTHNLTTTFLQMLGGFGLTYADYEGLVTGFLYLAMAAFIYKKFVIFLRRS